MKTKIFRLLVCLLLICSFMINLLPTRAEAISTGFAVSAGIAVSAILYGLGVAIGEYPDEFNSLVSEFITDMETAGVVVTNGLMDVMSLGSGLFGVKSDVIQNLFDWIYRTDTVSCKAAMKSINAGTYVMNMRIDGNSYAAALQINANTDVYTVYVISPNSFNWFTSNSGTRTASREASSGWYYAEPGAGSRSYLEGLGIPCYGYYDLKESGSSSVSTLIASARNGLTEQNHIYTEQDLTLNFVANPGMSLATGYPVWAANAVSIPNAETGEDETYYPIALGNSMEETQSFTQEQVWAGEGTYVDTETGTGTGSGSVTVPDTVTLKDILTGILSVPHSIAQAISGFFTNVVSAVQAIPAAIADFFTITAEDLALPISWKDFFPFCIPYDIYELVQVLDAEPEAPHFVFDVDFPYMKEPWHIDVDFAAWDPVALVLRRLELLLFIVGLAMATRNYYIRG